MSRTTISLNVHSVEPEVFDTFARVFGIEKSKEHSWVSFTVDNVSVSLFPSTPIAPIGDASAGEEVLA